MYLPLTSDAELRHWPFATGAMIVLNGFAYALQLAIPGSEDYALSHGDGLHPLQWITSFFMHGDLFHLLGNMLFLWIFGHMVEGAVGPGKFLGLYLGMGILQNFLEQWMFWDAAGSGSLGASAAIYAIMAVAALLCPEDQIQGYFLFFVYAFFVEIPMFAFAVFYIGFDIFAAVMLEFEASTPLLHAMGGVIGVIVGLALLKLGYIENDGRDFLTFMQPRGSQRKLTPRQLAEREEAASQARAEQERKLEMSLQSLEMHLKAENAEGCLTQWAKLQGHFPDYVMEENTTLALINLLQKKQRWSDVAKLGEWYLKHYTKHAIAIRLKIAVVLVSKLSRPNTALRILQGLALATLNDGERQQAHKISLAAKKMVADGVLDLSESGS